MSASGRGFLPTISAVVGLMASVVGVMSAGAAHAGDRLAGSRWAIVEVYGEPLAQDTAPRISFEDQGRISGRTACSWFYGSYSLDLDKILLLTRLTTLRGCEVGNRRQRDPTLEALDSTASYATDGYVLTLADGGGETVVRLVKIVEK